jgi:hypothetical protein
MLRRTAASVFLLAALLIVEPLLHNHPLQALSTSSAAACAICASGVGRLPTVAPSVGAFRIVIYTVVAVAVTTVSTAVALPLASRAPPAL